MKKMRYTHPTSDYDRDFNLLYVNLNPTIKTGVIKSKSEIDETSISNLAIYDIGKDKLTHFFDIGTSNNIISYCYETSYNEEGKRMEFSTQAAPFFNNEKIEKRAAANKLFVVTEKANRKEWELWISSKLGDDKKMVKSFPKDLEWKIDIFNQKVLFIYKFEKEIKIEAINW